MGPQRGLTGPRHEVHYANRFSDTLFGFWAAHSHQAVAKAEWCPGIEKEGVTMVIDAYCSTGVTMVTEDSIVPLILP